MPKQQRTGEVDGVAIYVHGAVAERIDRGSPSTAVKRSAGGAVDPLRDAIERSGLRSVANIDLEIGAIEPLRSRGGGAVDPPRVIIEPPPLLPGEKRHVVLVEEDGEYRWIFGDGGELALPLADDEPAMRGSIGAKIRKALKVLAVKATKPIAGLTGSLTRLAEDRLRPPRARSFTAANYFSAEAVAPSRRELTGGRALLIIHGFNSSIHGAFGELERNWVKSLNDRYGGRVFAFDHPTLATSPRENAEWLADWLLRQGDDLDPSDRYELDILCHSRGGLVARELAERTPSPRIAVSSIVFVGTPNNGTPLASAEHFGELLDVFTNLAAVIPDNPVTDALEVVLGLVQDVALGIATPELPGLDAMNPAGEYIETLNAAPAPRGEYRALAADFGPLSTDGRLRKLRDRLFDKVFAGAMNDLVVPTRSTYLRGGSFAIPAERRQVYDSSFGIDHSGFWRDPKALEHLADWLRPDHDDVPVKPVDPRRSDPNADAESALARAGSAGLADAIAALAALPGHFKDAINAIYAAPVSPPSTAVAEPLGDVVVLPGVMGTLLDADGERLWISPNALRKGGFEKLRAGGAAVVTPAGLHDTYAPLVTRLAAAWRTHLFAYDWRLDLFATADRLADFIRNEVWKDGERPVHLVAHSMGGLVARAFVARHRDLWDAMHDDDSVKRGGRLLMLGTPNLGSYAIPLGFVGEELLVKGLAAVDGKRDSAGIVAVMTSFASSYQMLPSLQLPIDDERARLFELATWSGTTVDGALLRRAVQTHEILAEDGVDAPRFIYIAGDKHRTPARLKITGGSFQFGIHDEGDGRVTHDSGRLPNVKMYFSAASHGGLVADATILDSLQELLQRGETRRLPETRLPRRGRMPSAPPLEMRPASQVDREPRGGAAMRGARGAVRNRDVHRQLEEATSHYLHVPERAEVPDVRLNVRVSHVSLEHADHPVAVGHYHGIPAEGAEGFLDHRLGGVLSRHRELGDYPEDESDVLFVPAAGQQPPGAIVLGLGGFGELTRTKLVRLIKQAAIRRAMDAAASVEAASGSTLDVGIAAVLIGTPGRHGLSVETSVAALIEGAARAAVRIAESDAGQRVRLEELQILELYEARAAHAAQVARDVRERLPLALRDIDLRLPDRIEVGRGGLPGLPSQNASGDPWVRIAITRETPASRDDDDRDLAVAPSRPSRLPRLRYTTLGRSAQIDSLEIEYDDEKIRALIDASITRPGATNATIALYEQMFPHGAKLELDDTDNLQILVDEDTASIPWEMLASASARDDREALALRTGMLRQLQRSDIGSLTRTRIAAPIGRYAMVVGDPPVGAYPRLPSARKEASEVEEMLQREGYEVSSFIYDANDEADEWQEILTGLYPPPFRILHFATHGQVTPGDPTATGLVIGDGKLLTALDFAKMSVTPDLVFINACHIGRTADSPGDLYRPAARANELAANVALRLMQNGVKAVIAAGWAVDDGAAREFARRFYEGMMNGEPFGEAVHRARCAAHDFDGGRSNTWGAYQCYGDPNFELEPARRVPTSISMPTSAAGVVRDLSYCEQQAADAFDRGRKQNIRDKVNEIAASSLPRFEGATDRVAILHALARVYAELGDYQDAVWAYRQAMLMPAAHELPLVAIEQLAHLETCLAARLALSGAAPAAAHSLDKKDRRPAALLSQARRRLENLLRLAETAERHALLGHYWKKRAAIEKKATQRKKSLAAAAKCYAAAAKAEPNTYYTCLWAQMAHLGKRPAAEIKAAGAALAALERRMTERAAHRSWRDMGDIAITRAMLAADDGEDTLAAAAEKYAKGFGNHCTTRERDSVLDHLRDLAELHPARETVDGLIAAIEGGG